MSTISAKRNKVEDDFLLRVDERKTSDFKTVVVRDDTVEGLEVQRLSPARNILISVKTCTVIAVLSEAF